MAPLLHFAHFAHTLRARAHTHGSTLPPPECFQKHSEALCQHLSASESTRKHSAAASMLPQARGGTLPAPRKHVAVAVARVLPGALRSTLQTPQCFRKHAQALCRRQSAPGSTRKHVAAHLAAASAALVLPERAEALCRSFGATCVLQVIFAMYAVCSLCIPPLCRPPRRAPVRGS